MEDFSAGHITDEEAREVILDLNKEMGTNEIQFYPGVSYRHLMVLKNGAAKFSNLEKLELTPPHDIIGKEISSFLPQSERPDSRPDDRVPKTSQKPSCQSCP